MRERKPGIRAVMRSTAEQDTPLCYAAGWYVGIEVVGKVGSRTCAHFRRHIFPVFAYHHALNITFLTWKFAAFYVIVIVGILVVCRVVASIERTYAAVRIRFNSAFASIRPTPNMPERVFYSRYEGTFTLTTTPVSYSSGMVNSTTPEALPNEFVVPQGTNG